MTELVGQAGAYVQGYEAAKREQLKERLKERIDACKLLGEAHGMLEGLLCSVDFQDTEHENMARLNVKNWIEKMYKFVNQDEVILEVGYTLQGGN